MGVPVLVQVRLVDAIICSKSKSLQNRVYEAAV
jgi:hypothetical protein